MRSGSCSLQALAPTRFADTTAPMLFWALLASGQIVMRKVDGWETLDQPLADQPIDLAA